MDEETVVKTVIEIVCGGIYWAEAEDILANELRAFGYTDQEIRLVLNILRKIDDVDNPNDFAEWAFTFFSDPEEVRRFIDDMA